MPGVIDPAGVRATGSSLANDGQPISRSKSTSQYIVRFSIYWLDVFSLLKSVRAADSEPCYTFERIHGIVSVYQWN